MTVQDLRISYKMETGYYPTTMYDYVHVGDFYNRYVEWLEEKLKTYGKIAQELYKKDTGKVAVEKEYDFVDYDYYTKHECINTEYVHDYVLWLEELICAEYDNTTFRLHHYTNSMLSVSIF